MTEQVKHLLINLYFLHSPLASALLTSLVIFTVLSIIPFHHNLNKQFYLFLSKATGFSALVFLAITAPFIIYFFSNPTPQIGDTTFGIVSWLWAEGGAIYHSPDNPIRYSLLYGPLPYILIGSLFKLFGPSILIVKWLTLFSTLLSFLGLWILLHTYYNSRTTCVALAFFCALIINVIQFPHLILLFVIYALIAYEKLRGIKMGIAIGVLCGLAISVKVHGGFYFLPIFGILLFKRNWVPLCAAVVASAITGLAPFFIHGISLSNYGFWLSSAAKHGLSMDMFLRMAEWFIFGLFLVIAFRIFTRASIREDLRLLSKEPFCWGLFISSLVILLFASKPGSNYHHLIPLFPSFFYAFAKWGEIIPAASAIQDAQNAPTARLHAFIALTVCLVWCISLTSLFYQSYSIARIPIKEMTADLEQILKNHHNQKVALGDSEPAPHTWSAPKTQRLGDELKYIPVFHGNPILYETGALMDMQKAGIALPRTTIDLMQSGYIQLWLFPKGLNPFELVNWYSEDEQVFSPEFRKIFYSNFEKRDSSKFYDLWFYRSLPTH